MSGSALAGGAVFEGEGQAAIRVGRGLCLLLLLGDIFSDRSKCQRRYPGPMFRCRRDCGCYPHVYPGHMFWLLPLVGSAFGRFYSGSVYATHLKEFFRFFSCAIPLDAV